MVKKNTYKIFSVMTAFALFTTVFTACSSEKVDSTTTENTTAKTVETTGASDTAAAEQGTLKVTATVSKDEKFGSAVLSLSEDDFKNAGFELGDSLDVIFNNGYSVADVPYYNGYYVKTGAPVVVAYPNNKYVKVALNNRDFWTAAGLEDGATAEITLNTAKKYIYTYEALGQRYSLDRNDFTSDEQYANFRAISVKKMKENFIYRGASPVDNEMSRASVVNALLQKAGVETIIDLADSEEEMQEYFADENFSSDYVKSLYEQGKDIVLSMSSNYDADSYKEGVANGMRHLLKNGGPAYIHCLEGKDRTGFVCTLLEALVGSTYDEMCADYMKTYENYYGISKSETPEKYDAIVSLYFDAFMSYLAGTEDIAALKTADYSGFAKRYLLDSGMTDSEVEQLTELLTK